jgi:hypothetical protein
MDDLNEEERQAVAANIIWLNSTGPDDWHRVALDFDWGEPLYVLDWIVQQDDCDMATALTIFWKGQPGYFITDNRPSNEKPDGFSYLNRKMCAYIAHRIASGGYKRSRIAYTPDSLTKQDFNEIVEIERAGNKTNFQSHPALIRRCRGRKVANDRSFYRRYPADFHHSVEFELPGHDLLSISQMARVKVIEFKNTLLRLAVPNRG